MSIEIEIAGRKKLTKRHVAAASSRREQNPFLMAANTK